ncbi:MAG: hypothetical protein HY301_17305 [Verrucomicrobia bacterium]|nr:hypothetical protein [Verrucomicrobiota bacterium]
MNKRLRIESYFSQPTDLAGEMREWPEFVTGNGYDVDLRNPDTEETVAVRYVESGERAFIDITATGNGSLFDRVAGRAIYALSGNSDNLTVDRYV